MQYPSFNRQSERMLTLADFSGGIDAAVADTALAANQLRNACNVYWQNGVLRTRPGFSTTPNSHITLPTIRLQADAPELTYISDRPGILRFIIHDTASRDGYSLAVLFCRTDGGMDVIRTSIHTADWTELPEQLLPIDDGIELGLVYVDGMPYRVSADGALSAISPYIPTAVIAARGSADLETARELTAPPGTSYEPFNRLTDSFRVEYILTEGKPYFTLPSACRHYIGVLTIELMGYYTQTYQVRSDSGISDITTSEFLGYQVCWSTPTGVFWFLKDKTPCVPDCRTWSSVRVTFTPHTDAPANRDIIKSMRTAVWFGGSLSGLGGGTRCFLAGSAQNPSLLCYSAVGDATYFPENNDAHVGQPGQAITALRKQSDMLVIFKRHEIWYTTYQNGVTDASTLTDALESGAVVDVEAAVATFPLACISSDIGCNLPGTLALCDNRLVWTNSDGNVYVLVSGNIYSERNVRSIGEAIRPLMPALTAETTRALDYDGHYYLQAGKQAFLFDYNAAALSAVSASTANDTLRKRVAWYRWEFPRDLAPDMLLADRDRITMAIWSGNTMQVHVIHGGKDAINGVSTAVRAELLLPIFSGGSNGRRQSVRTVTLDTDAAYTAVTVKPIGDRDDSEAHRRTVCTDASGIARFFAGLRRVREFSLWLAIDGPAVVRGISLSVTVH